MGTKAKKRNRAAFVVYVPQEVRRDAGIRGLRSSKHWRAGYPGRGGLSNLRPALGDNGVALVRLGEVQGTAGLAAIGGPWWLADGNRACARLTEMHLTGCTPLCHSVSAWRPA